MDNRVLSQEEWRTLLDELSRFYLFVFVIGFMLSFWLGFSIGRGWF